MGNSGFSFLGEIPPLNLVLWGILVASALMEILLRTALKNFSKTKAGQGTTEWVDAIFVAILLAVVIRGSVFQLFKIPSGSMMNTLLVKDHLVVNKFIFGWKIPFRDGRLLSWREPRRGDILVFIYPKDRSLYYIKRCMGLPGDLVEMRAKQLYINGEKLDEKGYAIHLDPLTKPSRDNFGPLRVPEGHYFMMGDNRDHSADSRYWGFLSENDIQGLAWSIYLPLSRLGLIAGSDEPSLQVKRNQFGDTSLIPSQ